MRRLLLVAVALVLPCVGLGFASDDLLLLVGIEAPHADRRRDLWALYDLLPRGATAQAITQGHVPWWSAPDLEMAFLRPLSSALFALDHALFGRWAAGYHLVSVLWLVALLGAWSRLLVRLLPRQTAQLAFALLCLDDAAALPATWIANRHALVGAALGFWGLEAQLAYKDDGKARWLWTAGVCYTLALSASEVALACIGYAFCFDTIARPERRGAARPQGSLCWLVPFAAYAVLYVALGKGAHGSSIYVSPGAVVSYVHALGSRGPALLADALLNVPALLWALGAPVHWLQGTLSVCGLLLCVALVRATAKQPSATRALFPLAAGGALALLPAVCALPSSRQLLPSSLASAAWLATWIQAARSEGAKPTGRRVAALFALLHLGVATVLRVAVPIAFHRAEQPLVGAAKSLDQVPDCASPARDVVLLAAPDHRLGVYTPLVRWALGLGEMRSFRVLSMAPLRTTMRVEDAHTMVLAADAPGFFRSVAERFWRDTPLVLTAPLRAGPFTVRRVDGATNSLRFRFDAALDSPAYCFVRYAAGRFQRILPKPGDALEVQDVP
jgi:hypothetical protein